MELGVSKVIQKLDLLPSSQVMTRWTQPEVRGTREVLEGVIQYGPATLTAFLWIYLIGQVGLLLACFLAPLTLFFLVMNAKSTLRGIVLGVWGVLLGLAFGLFTAWKNRLLYIPLGVVLLVSIQIAQTLLTLVASIPYLAMVMGIVYLLATIFELAVLLWTMNIYMLIRPHLSFTQRAYFTAFFCIAVVVDSLILNIGPDSIFLFSLFAGGFDFVYATWKFLEPVAGGVTIWDTRASAPVCSMPVFSGQVAPLRRFHPTIGRYNGSRSLVGDRQFVWLEDNDLIPGCTKGEEWCWR